MKGTEKEIMPGLRRFLELRRAKYAHDSRFGQVAITPRPSRKTVLPRRRAFSVIAPRDISGRPVVDPSMKARSDSLCLRAFAGTSQQAQGWALQSWRLSSSSIEEHERGGGGEKGRDLSRQTEQRQTDRETERDIVEMGTTG